MPTIDLPAEPSSPGAARRFVKEFLASRGVDQESIEKAALLVNEVATNSVVHAGTDFVLDVELSPSRIELSVTDGGSGLVHLREPAPDDVKGRGLLLVDRLASGWSVEHGEEGVRIRFFLEYDASADAPCGAGI